MAKRKTPAEFAEQMATTNPNIEIVSDYVNCRTKVNCICKTCGREWSALPQDLLNKHGCIFCAGKMQKTTEMFVEEMKRINSDIEILGEYINSKTPIECRCKICSYKWSTKPNDLQQGHGCVKCANRYKPTTDEFRDDMLRINPTITVIGKYENRKTPIECKCSVCGYTWFPTPNNLCKGSGCPSCAGLNKKTTKQFIDELKEINPDIIVLGEYKGSKVDIACKCKVCGFEWSARPNNLLCNRTSCPSCDQSKGERRIKTYLDKHGIRYKYEESFPGLIGVGGGALTYDFFIPDINILIEFQGGQHRMPVKFPDDDRDPEELFKIRMEHDKRKRLYADEHGLGLIEIWDYDFKNIEFILDHTILPRIA